MYVYLFVALLFIHISTLTWVFIILKCVMYMYSWNRVKFDLHFPSSFFNIHHNLPHSSLRPCPHFRIHSVFSPDTATVHMHPTNSTANLEKINPLSRVGKNKSTTNLLRCGRVNLDIFESNDVKSMSSLSTKNKPIWGLTWKHVSGEQSKFPSTISFYGACSEDILVQSSLGY